MPVHDLSSEKKREKLTVSRDAGEANWKKPATESYCDQPNQRKTDREISSSHKPGQETEAFGSFRIVQQWHQKQSGYPGPPPPQISSSNHTAEHGLVRCLGEPGTVVSLE